MPANISWRPAMAHGFPAVAKDSTLLELSTMSSPKTSRSPVAAETST